MIKTVDVRVDYDGLTAVRDLSLDIRPGEVFGLIGPNGAGKTSTIRVLATLQRPTYGEVFIGGQDVTEESALVHQKLGYMPDNPPVYADLKCWEFLDLFAGAYFLRRRDRRRRVDELLDQVSLTAKRDVMAGTLSTGMRQRLVLAKTLLPDPEVLLLDEPASGLDPIARIELRDLLTAEAERGKTVLVSSHILTELSAFCTSIGIMEKGELVESGRIEDIITRINAAKEFIIEFAAPPFDAIQRLEAQPGISNVRAVNSHFVFDLAGDDDDAVRLLRRLVSDGLPIIGFHQRRMGVEDIMLQVGAREVS